MRAAKFFPSMRARIRSMTWGGMSTRPARSRKKPAWPSSMWKPSTPQARRASTARATISRSAFRPAAPISSTPHWAISLLPPVWAWPERKTVWS